MKGVQPDALEKAHRDARNYLEGTLSRRPPLSKLLEQGYLEVTESHPKQRFSCQTGHIQQGMYIL